MQNIIREYIRNNYIVPKDIFIDVGSEKLKDSLFLVIENRLFSLLYDIILFEYNISGQKSIDDFIHYIFSDFGKSFLYKKYSYLEKMIDSELSQTVFFLDKFLYRLKKDLKNIGESFFGEIDFSFQGLTDIQFHLSDRHSESETVVVLEFYSKYKFLYKPRSLSIDLLYQYIISVANNHLNDDIFYKVKSINYGEYGWQIFVDRKDCISTEEVKKYYHRLGCSLSLIYLLGGTDFHHENIIPHGDFPVLIDLETIIQGERIVTNNNKGDFDKFLRFANIAFSKSLYRTGILPYIDDGIDVSAIGFDLQKKLPHVGINESKGKYKYLKSYKKNNEFSSSPILKGKKITIKNNLEYFIQGFEDSYYEISEVLRNKIIPTLKNVDVELRYVYRATQYYVNIVAGSNHPENLVNIDKRIKFILRYLEGGEKGKNDFSKGEIKDLWKNNIPKFTFGLHNNDVFIGKDKTSYSFSETPYETLKKNLSNLKPVHLLTREIQNSFNVTCQNNSIKTSSNKNYGKYDVNNLSTDYQKIEYIYKTIVETFIEEGEYIILPSTISKGHKLSYCLLGGGLYDGMLGVSLFFLAYYGYSSQEKSKIYAYKSLYTARNLLLKNIKDQSLYSGFMGYLYVGIICSDLLNDEGLLDLVFEDFDEYIHLPRRNKDLDIISGISGKLIVAIHLYTKRKNRNVKRYIEKCIEIIIKNFEAYGCFSKKSPTSFIYTGFAHGISGVIYTLQMYVSNIKKDKRIEEIIIKLISKEDIFYSHQEGNWENNRRKKEKKQYSWCYGAPGILLTRDVNNYNIDVGKFISNEFSDSMCHGNFGNLEIIHELGLEKIIGNYVDNGKYISGLPNNVYDIGFMTGLSGIGYGLIKNNGNINLPSIITLKILK